MIFNDETRFSFCQARFGNVFMETPPSYGAAKIRHYINIEYMNDEFLDKPLLQASLRDLKAILAQALRDNELEALAAAPPKRYVYGLAGLMSLFGCSISTAERIKQSGVIDQAISQTGDIIVVDAELALDLLRLSGKHKNILSRMSNH